MGEFNELEGLGVWAKSQETLEQQALHELNVFTEQTADETVEDGEIVNEQTQKEIKVKPFMLDLETFIKKQEDLKKIQDHKRSLEISERSQRAATQISARHNSDAKVKGADRVKKRKSEYDHKVSKKIKNVHKEHCSTTNEDGEQHINSCNESNSGSEYTPSDDYVSGK